MKHLKHVFAVFHKSKWRFGAYSMLVMLVMAAIGVLINIAVNSLENAYGWRKDYSFNGYTATGKDTQTALNTLSEPVTLYLLYQTGDMDSALYEVLIQYHYLNDHITVTPIDLAKNPGFVSLYEGDLQTSVTADSVVVNCETTGRYKILNYSDFLTQSYNIDSGSFEIAGLAYEKNVTEAILYVSQRDIPVVGILQGHGELSMDTLATLTNFLTANGYDVQPVNLITGDTLDTIGMLLIADPYKDFSEGEIETLKAFAQEGGSFFVMRDYTAPVNLTNYFSLLRNYDIIPLPGIVVASEKDKGSYYNERINLIPYLNDMDMTLPLIEAKTDVLMLAGACAFETPDGSDASLSSATVLKSGANAYLRDLTENNGSIAYQEGDPTGEFSLAIIAGRMHANGNISRMFAVGNSTLFTDAYMYQLTYNQEFIVQLMNELLPQKNVSLNIIAKPALRPGLAVQSLQPAIALLAALPALIFLLALFVLLPRRNR